MRVKISHFSTNLSLRNLKLKKDFVKNCACLHIKSMCLFESQIGMRLSYAFYVLHQVQVTSYQKRDIL